MIPSRLQSTLKEILNIKTRGFSVVEIVVASAIFTIATTIFIGSLISARFGFDYSAKQNRAVLLAEEGLEATRNIKDENFSNLVDGNHGLAISGNQWIFSGAQDMTDIYTRQIQISTIDANKKQVVSNVSWKDRVVGTKTVSLATRLVYWSEPIITTCASYCISLGTPVYTSGTCRRNNAACNNNGETRQIGGNQYCTIAPNNTCCCRP